MSSSPPTNLAASVRQRLLNLSKTNRESFDLVLVRYALERILYRLGVSEYADRFVLKGAMLLTAWGGSPHRPTRDLDLLGYGEYSDNQLIKLFREICRTKVEPDGLLFDIESIGVTEIREQEEHNGRRVQFLANLADAQIKVQVDIGFGDAVSPEANEICYPTLLEFPAPQIKAYPRESVVSEKLQAMVALGMPNSRMKDFYDVWMIAHQFPFDGMALAAAIKVTFDRRGTELPKEPPIALTDEFATDSDKIKQWEAFLNRTGLTESAVGLSQIIDELRSFLLPPLLATANEQTFKQSWIPAGPWS
jgi:predicted nucleotidyltransferase component of viral defense system